MKGMCDSIYIHRDKEMDDTVCIQNLKEWMVLIAYMHCGVGGVDNCAILGIMREGNCWFCCK